MKVYCGHKSWTRDNRIRWILEEAGQEYEVVQYNVFTQEQKNPEYLRLHPLGKIPYVAGEDFGMYESSAGVVFLAEQHAPDLIPTCTKQKALYYQWIFFCVATLEPAIVKTFANSYAFPNEEIYQQGKQEIENIFHVVEEQLSHNQYILGEKFTVADIDLVSTLLWMQKVNLLGAYPKAQEYFFRVSQREAFQKTFVPTEIEFEGYPGAKANSFRTSIDIEASMEKVYSSLTTVEGAKGWWTPDTSGDMSCVDGEVSFRFNNSYKKMRVVSLAKDREVVWQCMDHYYAPMPNVKLNKRDEWIRTILKFTIESNSNGCTLHFTHIGLTPYLDCYQICDDGWNYFMNSIKQFVETGEGTPFVPGKKAS